MLKKVLRGCAAMFGACLSYLGALGIVASYWSGDERSLFVAAVPAAFVAYLIYEVKEISCKRGRWIISSDGYYPYCSECQNEPKSGEMTDYCPNCGAYMK